MFEPGDIVELNSGGPEMVVIQTMGSGVLCAWEITDIFEVGIRQTNAPFQWNHESMLRKVSDAEGDNR